MIVPATVRVILICLPDVDVDKPDEKSIMTYIAQFLKHYPDPHKTETDGQGEEVGFFTASLIDYY